MYQNRKMIALCISKANNKRNFDMIASLNQAVNQYGYKLLVYHTCSDLYCNTTYEMGEKKVFELMNFEILDAVVIMEEAFYDKEMLQNINDKASAKDIPVISIGDTKMDCIKFLFHYVEGFEQVVRHMIEYHQIKDVMMMAGFKGELFSERRINVFKKVLAENEIPFRENMVIYGDYWWKPAEQAIEKVIAAGKLPQAIICANDSMAITVCDVLQKHKIRVPEDIIVSGFDGEEQAKMNLPCITTAGCNYDAAMQGIADVLQQIFVGKQTKKEFAIPYELEIGASCGCSISQEQINAGLLLNEIGDHFYKYQDSERKLYEISNRISCCNTSKEVVEYLRSYDFGYIAVFVNQTVFNEMSNPFEVYEQQGFDEKMFLLYHTGKSYQQKQMPILIDRKKELEIVADFMETTNPLIFSTISYGAIPLGYACFCYDTNKKEYDFIQQQLYVLNNALSSYWTLQYNRYMTKKMEDISIHDSMTKLYNRKGFYERLPELLQKVPKEDFICVASIDLDGLKHINDCYGHQNGDYAICMTANALTSLSLLENKIAARFGGDEMVFCCSTDKPEQTEKFIQQEIYEYLDKINKTGKNPFTLSASIGISTVPVVDFCFDDILKQSDRKMYQEKKGKPNHR